MLAPRTAVVRVVVWALAGAAWSCSSEADDSTVANGAQSGISGNGGGGGNSAAGGKAPIASGGGLAIGGGAGQGSGASGGSGGACDPPDMLFVVDRTLTMHHTPAGAKPTDGPEYKSSKWYQAIAAIEQVVAPPTDQTVRFGLELWPRDPGSGACNTLAQQVSGRKTTNASCEGAEIPVPPALGTGKQIQDLLDPTTTRLCFSTPTGKALQDADQQLAAQAVADREQFLVLVTDGADWDKTCPKPNPLPIVQQLAKRGVRTFVVGFFDASGSGGGVGKEFLNNLACAGQTAKDFSSACVQTADGHVTASGVSETLYFQATSASELAAALKDVAGQVCCDCLPA